MSVGLLLALPAFGQGKLCDWEFISKASLGEVEQALKEGASVNAKDSLGRTPLHRVAALNKDPNEGWVPLHFAVARNKHPEIITALIKVGANQRAENNFQKFPGDYIELNQVLRKTPITQTLVRHQENILNP